MKLAWIAIFILVCPTLGWWLGTRDPERREAARMADRDREAQARRAPHRRLKYSQMTYHPCDAAALAARRPGRDGG